MNSKILIPLGIVVLIAGVFIFGNSAKPEDASTVSNTATGSNFNGETAKKTNDTQSWYTDYSAQTLDDAIDSDKKTLIFFYADWCSTCKAASKDFQSNQDQISSDITIIKANYDKEKDLKKKYGITVQHTFVLLDEKGEVLTKWVGGGPETLLLKLQKL